MMYLWQSINSSGESSITTKVEGVLKPVNPATLAELVKLQMV